MKDLLRLREDTAATWLLQIPLPVPLEFLQGLDFQLADSEELQSAYLLGWTRSGGWWHWYVVASLIKLPLPVLSLWGLSLSLWPSTSRGYGQVFWASLCLVLPATEVALVISCTTGTGTNAAFRYLIPSIGLLCIWVGGTGRFGPCAIRSTSPALLAWLAISAIVATPDHLAWQNELGWIWDHWSGRPALIGDSLDWGQDVARLSQWVSRHSDQGGTLVCVYGIGGIDPYVINPAEELPHSPNWACSAFLAVSENVLQGYSIDSYLYTRGFRFLMTPHIRDFLLHRPVYARIGRTIRIYRIRDLTTALSQKPVSAR